MAFSFSELFPRDRLPQVAAPNPYEAEMQNILSSYDQNKFDPKQLEAMMSAAGKTSEEPALRPGDGWRALLDWGLGTMAAGAKPGATLLGAIGEGGQSAMKGAESRQGTRQKRADSEAEKRMKVLDTILAAGEADKKFKYQAEQDDLLHQLRQEELALNREQLNRPKNELVQDADGNYVLVNTNAAAGATGVSGMHPRDKLAMEIFGRAAATGMMSDDMKEQLFNDLQRFGRPSNSSTPTEGSTATNPTTGEKLVFRNGQWGKM